MQECFNYILKCDLL